MARHDKQPPVADGNLLHHEFFERSVGIQAGA
jgi:hypothetical protein